MTLLQRTSYEALAGLTLALLAWAPGCATKEVALNPGAGGADDAGVSSDAAVTADTQVDKRFPTPFCLTFVDANGANCTACYDEWGDEIARDCKPPPPKCQAREEASGTRCLYCDDNPTVARACLKCNPPAGGCAECSWSDNTTLFCKRCSDASGVVTTDSCDTLRGDLK